MWNNTMQVGGEASQEAFGRSVLFQRDNIAALRAALEYDLGSFSGDYSRYMMKKDPCGSVVLNLAGEEEYCSELFGGILK